MPHRRSTHRVSMGIAAVSAAALFFPLLPSQAFADEEFTPQPVISREEAIQAEIAQAREYARSHAATQTDSSKRVDVIVLLSQQPLAPSGGSEQSNLASQNALISELSAKYQLTVRRQFGYLVNGFEASIPANQIRALQNETGVTSVQKERLYYPTENYARDLQGVSSAFEQAGVDGTGMVVSIIDTGIDPKHQDMRLDNCDAAKLKPQAGAHYTCKVPNGWNYADENDTIWDTGVTQHGMHVAGIVAANGSEGSEKAQSPRIDGAAPNAQLLAMKVFSNSGAPGARDADIVAAIEDSVKMGADVINMSLGSDNGSNNYSDGAYRALEKAREAGVLPVVSAGNSGLNFSPDGTTDDIAGLLDDATIGSPSSYDGAFSVASVENSIITQLKATWRQGDEESSFPYQKATGTPSGEEVEIVDVGLGRDDNEHNDFEGKDLNGKYALIERGEITFTDKFQHAIDHGAIGAIVFNREGASEEFVGMAGVEDFTIFGASIRREDGLAIREALESVAVKVAFTTDASESENPDELRPSGFTSWGPTPELNFKPQIAGIGGNVWSTQNGNSYTTMSGTSMAAPNISGLSALVLQYNKNRYKDLSPTQQIDRTQVALMNTATILRNSSGAPYAPRQIGAGLAHVDKALATNVYATVDGKAYAELKHVNSSRNFTVTLNNEGEKEAVFNVPAQEVVNESDSEDGQTVTSVATSERLFASEKSVTVPAHGSASVTFTLSPRTAGEDHYVEGWARFVSATEGQPDIALPYLGFVGDWNKEPILVQPGENYLGADPVNDGLTGKTLLNTKLFTWDIPLQPDSWMSPNGDSFNDSISPSLALLRNASDIQYEVIDAATGAQVVNLGYDQTVSRSTLSSIITEHQGTTAYDASSHSFNGMVWNPEKNDFEVVPDGSYIYRVKARLSEDFDWQTYDMPFRVDATGPSIEISDRTEDGTVTLTITDEFSGVSSAMDITDSNGNSLDATQTGPQTWTVKVGEDVTFITVEAMDKGYTSTIKTKVFANALLSVNREKALDGQLVGVARIKEGVLPLSGHVSGDIATVRVNGEEAERVDADWAYGYTPVEGEQTVTIEGLNEAGEVVAHRTLTFTFDGVPPQLTVNEENNGSVELNDDGSVTLTGTISDTREGAELTVTSGNVKADVAPDGSYSITLTPKQSDLSITLVASDGVNTTTKNLVINGRGAGPSTALTPAFTSPATCRGLTCFADPSSEDTKDASLVVRGTISPEVTRIEFTPAVRANEQGVITKPEPIIVSVKPDGTFEGELPMNPGVNDFRVRTFVQGENGEEVAVDTTAAFYFDSHVPAIVFSEPGLVNHTLVTKESPVTISGSVWDDAFGYRFTLNGNVVAEQMHLNGIGRDYNERNFSEKVDVKDGDVLLISASDQMGNVIAGLVPVAVDNQAPELALNAQENEVIEDQRVLHVTAHDPWVKNLRVSVNGKEVASTANDSLIAGKIEDEMLDLTKDSASEEGSSDSATAASFLPRLRTHEATAEDAASEEVSEGGVATPRVEETEAAVAAAEEGSEDEKVKEDLSLDVPTADWSAGSYTVTAESVDAAGNVSAKSVTVVVDAPAQITGPDSVDLTVKDTELSRTADIFAAVLKNYQVSDDGAAGAEGETELSIRPVEALNEGSQQLTIVARDAAGKEVTRVITLNLTVEKTQVDNPEPGEGEGSNDGENGGQAGDGNGDGAVNPQTPTFTGSHNSPNGNAGAAKAGTPSFGPGNGLAYTGSASVPLAVISLMMMGLGAGVLARSRGAKRR